MQIKSCLPAFKTNISIKYFVKKVFYIMGAAAFKSVENSTCSKQDLAAPCIV